MVKQVILFAILLCFSSPLSGQQVTTLNQNSNVDDALIFDADGNLYGSRYMGSAVHRLSPDDWSSEVFSGGYNTPNGLAFAANGDLYMADNVGNKIYKIFEDGSSEVFIDNFFSPSGLIFELDSDTLIATSYLGDRIVKIAPDGGQVIFSEDGLLNGPVGLCYDDDGRLYCGNYTDRHIMRLEENGEQVSIAQSSGSGALGFIAFAKGYIYGTLFNQHKIYRTDLMGNDTIILGTSAGTVDGDATTARFNGPNGIIASPSQDTLYISEFNSQAIRMITDLLPTTTAVESLHKTGFRFALFPNPTSTPVYIRLELKYSMPLSIQLFDQSGKMVQQVCTSKWMVDGLHTIPLNVDNLPSGTYHIRVRSEGGQVASKSFVKS